LSRGSLDRQTAHSHPIIGTPCEVPVPRKVMVSSGMRVGFRAERAAPSRNRRRTANRRDEQRDASFRMMGGAAPQLRMRCCRRLIESHVMAALLSRQEILTTEEYLARERAALERNEYLNGIVVAMAGGTFLHDLVKVNLQSNLVAQLKGRPCYVFTSDMKVRIERANLFRYPDLSALCGPILFHDEQKDAYGNPALIAEILSPSTSRYDRTEKFALYRFLDSLVEYLLVAQDRQHAELLRKGADGQWTAQIFSSAEETLLLESIGCTLRLGDLYDKVPLPAPAA
jgi:Uma2 family endonuclease